MDELYKGHDAVLRAMAAGSRAACPHARWVVLGDGQLRGHYEQTSGALGLDGAVVLPGASR